MKKIALLLILALLIPGCVGFSKQMQRWDDSLVDWLARVGEKMNQLEVKMAERVHL